MVTRRARGRRSLAVGVLATMFIDAGLVRAELNDPSTSRLVLLYEAPRECEGASGVRERVTSLVRSHPRTWKSAVEVRITIERVERGYVARVVVVQAGATEHAPSERALRAGTCAAVVEAITVSAATAVDDALEEAASERAPSHEDVEPPRRTEARATEAAPPKAPKRIARSPPPPLELRVGEVVALRGGLAPDPLLLETASISMGRQKTFWPPPLRAELTFGASPVARMPEGAYRTRLFEGVVAVCTPEGEGFFAVATLCAGAGGGVLATSSFEVARPMKRDRSWMAAFAAPRLSVPVIAGIRLVVEGRLLLPFFRESESFYPGITVYEAPAVSLQAAIGVEVSLPSPSRRR